MLFPFTKKMISKYSKTTATSLLPVFGKIFEKLVFNEIFQFFMENGLVSSNQSEFKFEKSCIN